MKRKRMLQAIRSVVSAARAVDGRLDDPHGDGSGRDAQAPDGDSYNELWACLEPLFEIANNK
jgi:hypothetical protein